MNLRKQVGRGSKWRTYVVLFGILFVMLLALYLRTRQEVPAAYRPYVYAAVFVLFVVIFLWQRARRRKRSSTNTRIEVTSAEFTILGADSKVTMPWSAFSDCLESPNLFVLVDRPKGALIVLPKRAFPDESWQNWFRARAGNRPPPALQPSLDAPVQMPFTSTALVTLRFRLAYRDYLDLTLASSFTWGMILFIGGVLLSTSLYGAAHPDPDAVNSNTKIFLMFELPFLLVMAVMVVLIVSIHNWRAHAKYLVPQGVSLGEESISFAGPDGMAILPWTTYKCYKETRWSFILWQGYRLPWMMLPKRAFASADDVQRCRALLSRHLRPSRWFFG